MVLLIAVPSLVLTWLAARVVEQEAVAVAEKTEQIYQNAVNEVARRAIDLFSELASTVAELSARDDFIDAPLDHVVEQLEEVRRQHPSLTLYFLYDEDGRLGIPIASPSLWPWVLAQQAPVGTLPNNPALRQAVALEFQEGDFHKAIAAYEEAERTAGDDFVARATALNGEARCYFRLQQYETAIQRYLALGRLRFAPDSTGLPAELVSRYMIGRVLKAQNRPQAFLNQRIEFLRWLFNPEVMAFLNPTQRAFYQDRIQRGIEEMLGSNPKGFEREDQAYREVLAEGQKALQEQARNQQLLRWLTAQVQPRVLADLAAGPLGSRNPVFVEGALGPGEPAVICYGVCRRPQDGTPQWVVGFVLGSNALRERLDPSRVTEFRFLEQSNLRIQAQDSVGNILVGEIPQPYRVLRSLRLPSPFPAWDIRLVATGPVPIPSATRTRQVLLIGLVTVSAVAIGVGIFVTLWTSAREIRTARMRSDFVSAITHELKTPLTSISMFAEMMRLGRYRSDEERRRYVEAISDESQRLTRLIEQVLNFARIERGTRTYRFETVEPAELVDRALDAMHAQLERGRFEVSTEVEEDLPAVRADPDAITEVLVNFLSNAAKYSLDDRRIALRAFRRNGNVCISVADHGIGISRKHLRRIFDKFYRAPVPQVEETDGTGLGLTVSLSIARAHGGTIDVESEAGSGSTFTLVLPAHRLPTRSAGSAQQPRVSDTT